MEEKIKLQHLVLRVPKDQAAFTYFQFESNEGLCFYSTLDSSLKAEYRDIELFSPLSLRRELTNLLSHLKNEVSYKVIEEDIYDDSKELVHLHHKFGKKAKGQKKELEYFNNKSSIYGPVQSWRLGLSLGIDPIFQTSTCSFNCFYCQLGSIQNITDQIKIYISTEKVLNDFEEALKKNNRIDVATYSGSGEPTLAANIHEMIKGIRSLSPQIPQMLLTNATELYLPEVRKRLFELDKIIVKIDAATEEIFQRINRPAKGVTLKRVIEGIKALQKEYTGPIEVQSMFMPLNIKEAESYAKLLNELRPSLVQLNTPKRPYPNEWHRENRGNHKEIFDYKTTTLKTLSRKEALAFESFLKKETGLEILSIYK